MSNQGYGQFCPIAMTAEVLGTRWTILILRELLCGSSRFNELKRGLPRISPALLSKRLGELQQSGLLVRRSGEEGASAVYQLTEAGEELRPLILSMGGWGQRWLESQLSPKNLDPSLLMWDMRRNLNPTRLPERRVTIQFVYPEWTRGQKEWWLIVDKSAEAAPVDLCMIDPGHEIDLYVMADVRAMTAIWMGMTTVRQAIRDGSLRLSGAKDLADHMQEWLGLSVFAGQQKKGGARVN